jgi:TRAP-type C4-dicarboxylate transport system permease small subunit
VKRFVATVGITFGLIGYACYLILDLTRRNLEALSRVPPLSWDAVSLVWTYAFVFTAAVVMLLIALAAILFAYEARDRYVFIPRER